MPMRLGHEEVARDQRHRLEHTLVADSPLAEMRDQLVAASCVLFPLQHGQNFARKKDASPASLRVIRNVAAAIRYGVATDRSAPVFAGAAFAACALRLGCLGFVPFSIARTELFFELSELFGGLS